MKEKKRILIIEDDPVLSNNIEELLLLAGYDVCNTDNGIKGLQLAREFNPHLVLSDILMPGTDGFSVLHAFRANHESSSVPIIMMTGKTDNSTFRQAMEKGADDFLFKPFKDIELLNAIERRLMKSEETARAVIPIFNSPNENVKQNNHLDQLLADAEEITAGKGEVIFAQGQAPNHVYFIAEGIVCTYRVNGNARVFASNLLTRDQLLGYQAVFDNEPRKEKAQALTNSVLKKIPVKHFKNAILNHPEISEYFLQYMSKALSYKEEEIMRVAYDSVRYRISKKLLELHEINNGQGVDIPRIILAQSVGTSPETLARTLRELKDMQMITTSGKKIFIPDTGNFKKKIEKF